MSPEPDPDGHVWTRVPESDTSLYTHACVLCDHDLPSGIRWLLSGETPRLDLGQLGLCVSHRPGPD